VTRQIFSARAPEGCLFFCADWGVKILMKSALFEPKILKFEKKCGFWYKIAVFGTRKNW
jgi:hypothetical protein